MGPPEGKCYWRLFKKEPVEYYCSVPLWVLCSQCDQAKTENGRRKETLESDISRGWEEGLLKGEIQVRFQRVRNYIEVIEIQKLHDITLGW